MHIRVNGLLHMCILHQIGPHHVEDVSQLVWLIVHHHEHICQLSLLGVQLDLALTATSLAT